LVPVARRLSFPVLVTEGFGEIPKNSAAFSLLTTNVGREVTVDGRAGGPYSLERPEVIIPLPAARQVALPDEVVLINPGVRVRVVQAPHIGAVGVVREIPARAVAYPSGVLARSARVELEGSGPAMIPLANLEILQ
jgi:RNase P/RNase MRP subunit p29